MGRKEIVMGGRKEGRRSSEGGEGREIVRGRGDHHYT